MSDFVDCERFAMSDDSSEGLGGFTFWWVRLEYLLSCGYRRRTLSFHIIDDGLIYFDVSIDSDGGHIDFGTLE